ncbi:hypothetical protein AB0873_14835 [Micromonospora sp. NPDC047707]|uniref:hypothetical protein n=1 Tax=Micromonospora sp. NPDC047707 TaxID=3154498 RepID=UPI0034515379
MRDLDVQDAITLLLAVAVLLLAITVWVLTRPPAAAVPAAAACDGDGEVTQELPPMCEVWQAFYATAPRRRRRWPILTRRPR